MRVRLGTGVQFGGSESRFRDLEILGYGPGPYLRVGVQFSDLVGVDVESSFGFIPFTFTWRSALAVSVTPTDWFTFSAGPVLGGNSVQELFGRDDSSTYAGGTARVDLHVARLRTAAGGTRQAMTVGLAGDLGATISRTGIRSESTAPGFAWGGYVMIGYSLY